MRGLHLMEGGDAIARPKLGHILAYRVHDAGNVIALVDGVGIDLGALYNGSQTSLQASDRQC